MALGGFAISIKPLATRCIHPVASISTAFSCSCVDSYRLDCCALHSQPEPARRTVIDPAGLWLGLGELTIAAPCGLFILTH